MSLGSRLPRTAHSHALLTRSWKQPEREAPEPSAKQQGAGIEGEPGRREKSQEKGEETDKTRGGGGRRGEEKRREERKREERRGKEFRHQNAPWPVLAQEGTTMLNQKKKVKRASGIHHWVAYGSKTGKTEGLR